MNDLVKFGGAGLPATPDDLAKGLQNVNQTLKSSAGGSPFLRLLKSGIYAYGQENIEPEVGSEWAVNPYSMMHGFACWDDGDLIDERMVPFNQPLPPRSELPDYGAQWNQQVSMMLQCLTGEDTGTTVLYKGTSTGLRNAVKQLIDAIILQIQHDKDHIVPVMTLEADSYKHKRYGDIYFPVLDIKRWIGMTKEAAKNEAEGESQTASNRDDEPQPENPPAGNRRGRAQPTEKEPEDPPPSNRRRRRNAG